MKKKIGEIYNIPVVIGNKNEVTKNEIHVEELVNFLQGGNDNTIQFTINGILYKANKDMTWGEFVASNYNDGSVGVNESYGYIRQNGSYLSSSEGGYVMEDDTIISGFNYQYLEI